MAHANGLRTVAYFDCPGGGQVVVSGTNHEFAMTRIRPTIATWASLLQDVLGALA